MHFLQTHLYLYLVILDTSSVAFLSNSYVDAFPTDISLYEYFVTQLFLVAFLLNTSVDAFHTTRSVDPFHHICRCVLYRHIITAKCLLSFNKDTSLDEFLTNKSLAPLHSSAYANAFLTDYTSYSFHVILTVTWNG
jgi:hypothetical protein